MNGLIVVLVLVLIAIVLWIRLTAPNPGPRVLNVGRLSELEWDYNPQGIIVAESWSTGPYCISKHHGKFFLVKNHTLLAIVDTHAEASALAFKDLKESP